MAFKAKLLIGLNLGVLMTTIALPVQAALIVGAPQQLSGSVVRISSSGSVSAPPSNTTSATQPTIIQSQPSTQTPTSQTVPSSITIGASPSSNYTNVISLKNNSQTSKASTAPSTPANTTTTPPTAPTAPSAPAANLIPPVSALTAEEQQMVDMINQERLAAGLSPVIADLRLTAVGRTKANDMKENNYFSHTSPTYGSPWAMMQMAGLTVRWAGENISGNKSVTASMSALMQSPGHRANILDPRFTHVGVGIAYGTAYGTLYVQEFLQE